MLLLSCHAESVPFPYNVLFYIFTLKIWWQDQTLYIYVYPILTKINAIVNTTALLSSLLLHQLSSFAQLHRHDCKKKSNTLDFYFTNHNFIDINIFQQADPCVTLAVSQAFSAVKGHCRFITSWLKSKMFLSYCMHITSPGLETCQVKVAITLQSGPSG